MMCFVNIYEFYRI